MKAERSWTVLICPALLPVFFPMLFTYIISPLMLVAVILRTWSRSDSKAKWLSCRNQSHSNLVCRTKRTPFNFVYSVIGGLRHACMWRETSLGLGSSFDKKPILMTSMTVMCDSEIPTRVHHRFNHQATKHRSIKQTDRSCFCHCQSDTSLKLDVLSCSTTSMLWIVSRISAFNFSSKTWAPVSAWPGSSPASDTLIEVYDSSWLLSWRRKPERSCWRIACSQFSVKRIISARHSICKRYVTTITALLEIFTIYGWTYAYILLVLRTVNFLLSNYPFLLSLD